MMNNNKINLKTDSIYKLFFYFFIPNLCAMLAMSTYHTIDGIFVGKKLGENALAAVGLCWPVFPVLMAFELLFSLGAAAIASYFLGKGQYHRARLVFSSVCYFASISSILIGLLLFIFVEEISLLLGANEQILPFVIEYLQVIFLGSFIVVLQPLLDVFAINDKRPILAMVAMIIGALCNIALNYVFLFILEWGIFGSAFATVLGYFIGMLILLSHFVRKKGQIYLVKQFSINAVLASAKNGIPQSISELSVAFIMIAFNHTLKSLAYTQDIAISYLATYSIVMYVGGICFTVLLSCAQGVQPVVSFNYGAGQMRRVKGIFAFGIIFATALGACMYGLFMSIDTTLVRLFLKVGQESILQSTLKAMSVYCLGYILLGFNIISAIFFQSIQRPKSSFIITISYNFIFVLILLFTLAYLYGINGVWYAYPLSLVCSSAVVCCVILYESRFGVLKNR